jgi:hypothetical protein
MCAWLKKRAQMIGAPRIITSTGARGVLSKSLYEMYEERRLTGTKFKALLDHLPETSLKEYQRDSDDDSE